MATFIQDQETRKRFFEELYALDDDDESNGSTEAGASQRDVDRVKRRRTLPSDESEINSTPAQLVRAQTEPSPRRPSQSPVLLKRRREPEKLPPKRHLRPAPPVEQLDSSPAVPSRPRKAKMPVKKKLRKGELPEILEAQQILKGMVFYFVPNNDVSQPRKRRIQKAQQYGAIRASEFSNDVTHIVVDKSLTFKDLITHFEPDEVPSTADVVNEDYPAECIGFHTIVDPTRSRFRLDGQEVVVKACTSKDAKEPTATQDHASTSSPSGVVPTVESSVVNEPQEPSPSVSKLGSEVGDSQEAQMIGGEGEEKEDQYHHDDLSKVIQEMKGTGHLVSNTKLAYHVPLLTRDSLLISMTKLEASTHPHSLKPLFPRQIMSNRQCLPRRQRKHEVQQTTLRSLACVRMKAT